MSVEGYAACTSETVVTPERAKISVFEPSNIGSIHTPIDVLRWVRFIGFQLSIRRSTYM